jgi:hypothetical protein
MKWESQGLIFSKKNFPKWNITHAWVPTPIMIKKSICRVYYAGRNKNNMSQIGAFDIDLNNPKKIRKVFKKPLLELGKRGHFDDCAVIPSHIFKVKNIFYMFYAGWTQAKTVPYITSIGLAVTKNLNVKFKRYSDAPVLGRTKNDPIFTSSCFVQKNKKMYKMFYTSNLSWGVKNNNIQPKYTIKEASSNNLVNWKYKSVTLKHKRGEIAITRPWIYNDNSIEKMLYSYRSNFYKIGLAEKINDKWKRKDSKIKILKKQKPFDKKSQEYCSVINYKNKKYMFYNGDNYGEDGVGLAILK